MCHRCPEENERDPLAIADEKWFSEFLKEYEETHGEPFDVVAFEASMYMAPDIDDVFDSEAIELGINCTQAIWGPDPEDIQNMRSPKIVGQYLDYLADLEMHEEYLDDDEYEEPDIYGGH